MKYKEEEENNTTRGTHVNNYTTKRNIVLQLLVALTCVNSLEVSTSTDPVLTESQSLLEPEVLLYLLNLS